MAEVTLTRDGVFIEESVHGLFQSLTDGTDPMSSPFRTMKDLFMWAASYGFRSEERRQLAGKRVMIFRWSQFSPQIDMPTIKAMAIAAEVDLSILARQEEILTIAEEYANAGIHALRTLVTEDARPVLWALVQEVNEPISTLG